jgi:hypothetical protein
MDSKMYIIKNVSGKQVILCLSENATPENSLVISPKAVTKYMFTAEQIAYARDKYRGIISFSESV